ncbi:hypothetical protein JCM1393_25140 [Clostridium carnis]
MRSLGIVRKVDVAGRIPKVKIHEFLDSNKNWCIRVHVNDELVDSKNIEFISERKTAPEVPVQGQLLKIHRNLKAIQFRVTAYSLTIMIMLNILVHLLN